MATIAELNTRREALAASRSSGVARVSYDGKTVEYRSLADPVEALFERTRRKPNLANRVDEVIEQAVIKRTHQGKMCCGRTPFQTMIEGKQIWKEKFVN